MEGSDQRCRGAIRGAEERSEAERSDQRWRRSVLEVEGSDQSLRWRGAIRGGGK